jgi:hypothetical protein
MRGFIAGRQLDELRDRGAHVVEMERLGQERGGAAVDADLMLFRRRARGQQQERDRSGARIVAQVESTW